MWKQGATAQVRGAARQRAQAWPSSATTCTASLGLQHRGHALVLPMTLAAQAVHTHRWKHGLKAALAHAAPDVPETRHPELGERYRHHYMAEQHRINLFEGTLAMLTELRARQHLLTVATGKSRSGLDIALQAVELRGLFDASRTADETAGKPNPRMLYELMAEFGATPERTLMIGDTTHDLQMARNAGCASVAVSYGAHSPEAFGALGPLFVAQSVPQLHQWLLHHG